MYRLLEENELICVGDEFFALPTENWLPVHMDLIGKFYTEKNKAFWPVRRKINTNRKELSGSGQNSAEKTQPCGEHNISSNAIALLQELEANWKKTGWGYNVDLRPKVQKLLKEAAQQHTC